MFVQEGLKPKYLFFFSFDKFYKFDGLLPILVVWRKFTNIVTTLAEKRFHDSPSMQPVRAGTPTAGWGLSS